MPSPSTPLLRVPREIDPWLLHDAAPSFQQHLLRSVELVPFLVDAIRDSRELADARRRELRGELDRWMGAWVALDENAEDGQVDWLRRLVDVAGGIVEDPEKPLTSDRFAHSSKHAAEALAYGSLLLQDATEARTAIRRARVPVLLVYPKHVDPKVITVRPAALLELRLVIGDGTPIPHPSDRWRRTLETGDAGPADEDFEKSIADAVALARGHWDKAGEPTRAGVVLWRLLDFDTHTLADERDLPFSGQMPLSGPSVGGAALRAALNLLRRAHTALDPHVFILAQLRDSSGRPSGTLQAVDEVVAKIQTALAAMASRSPALRDCAYFVIPDTPRSDYMLSGINAMQLRGNVETVGELAALRNTIVEPPPPPPPQPPIPWRLVAAGVALVVVLVGMLEWKPWRARDRDKPTSETGKTDQLRPHPQRADIQAGGAASQSPSQPATTAEGKSVYGRLQLVESFLWRGLNLRREGRNDEERKVVEEALAIAVETERKYPDQNEPKRILAWAYIRKAEALWTDFRAQALLKEPAPEAMGEIRKAYEAAKDILTLGIEKVEEKKLWSYALADALSGLGDTYKEKGWSDLPKAIALYEEALGMREKHDKSSTQMRGIRHRLADAFIRHEHVPIAMTHWDELIELLKNHDEIGTNFWVRLELADAKMRKAETYVVANDSAGAMKQYEDARAEFREAGKLAKNTAESAHAEEFQAHCSHRIGQILLGAADSMRPRDEAYSRALTALQEALAYLQKRFEAKNADERGARYTQAYVLTEIAQCLRFQGDYAKALGVAKEGLQIREELQSAAADVAWSRKQVMEIEQEHANSLKAEDERQGAESLLTKGKELAAQIRPKEWLKTMEEAAARAKKAKELFRRGLEVQATLVRVYSDLGGALANNDAPMSDVLAARQEAEIAAQEIVDAKGVLDDHYVRLRWARFWNLVGIGDTIIKNPLEAEKQYKACISTIEMDKSSGGRLGICVVERRIAEVASAPADEYNKIAEKLEGLIKEGGDAIHLSNCHAELSYTYVSQGEAYMTAENFAKAVTALTNAKDEFVLARAALGVSDARWLVGLLGKIADVEKAAAKKEPARLGQALEYERERLGIVKAQLIDNPGHEILLLDEKYVESRVKQTESELRNLRK